LGDNLAKSALEAQPQSVIWPEVVINNQIVNDQEVMEDKLDSRGENADTAVLFATVTNTYEGMVCMSISPSASEIYCGFNDSCIRMWSSRFSYCESQKLDTVLPSPADVSRDFIHRNANRSENPDALQVVELRGHSKPVYSLSHDPSGRLLLSTSADESVRLWDCSSARCLARYQTLGPCWDVDFGPFGFYFSLAHQNRTASIYATDSEAPLRVLCGHVSDVTCCRWHPNASYLLTGSDDRTLRLWDIRSGPCVSKFINSVSPTTKISFSSGGNYFAAGCENGSIVLWDLRFYGRNAILENQSGPILDLCFSPDNMSLCSGGHDCAIRIWDVSLFQNGRDEVFSQPSSVFYTKYSQVYAVRYDNPNLIYAGGPFSLNNQNSKFDIYLKYVFCETVMFLY
jgi:transcription initiation factor TFIID subunit 5